METVDFASMLLAAAERTLARSLRGVDQQMPKTAHMIKRLREQLLVAVCTRALVPASHATLWRRFILGPDPVLRCDRSIHRIGILQGLTRKILFEG